MRHDTTHRTISAPSLTGRPGRLAPRRRDHLDRDEVGLADTWCDADGEFLTTDGFVRVACEACGADALRRRAFRHWCAHHLPDGDQLPGWLRAVRPGR